MTINCHNWPPRYFDSSDMIEIIQQSVFRWEMLYNNNHNTLRLKGDG